LSHQKTFGNNSASKFLVYDEATWIIQSTSSRKESLEAKLVSSAILRSNILDIQIIALKSLKYYPRAEQPPSKIESSAGVVVKQHLLLAPSHLAPHIISSQLVTANPCSPLGTGTV